MSKFHSTVSRRDFMKGLGLAGAGLGAAVATTPVFHDLDELISSANDRLNNPWWVKDVAKPPMEIDWGLMGDGIDLRRSPSHGHDKTEWAAYVGGEDIRQKHSADQRARRAN